MSRIFAESIFKVTLIYYYIITLYYYIITLLYYIISQNKSAQKW